MLALICYEIRYGSAGTASSSQHSQREEERLTDSTPSNRPVLSTIVSVDSEAEEISSGARLRPPIQKHDEDDLPGYLPGSPSEVKLRKARTTRGSEEGPLPSDHVEDEMRASSKVSSAHAYIYLATISFSFRHYRLQVLLK